MGRLAREDCWVNRKDVVWACLAFGSCAWMYSYYPESRMVRARLKVGGDIWRHISDPRCIFDGRIRPAWWWAVKWEVMRIFNRRRIR